MCATVGAVHLISATLTVSHDGKSRTLILDADRLGKLRVAFPGLRAW